MSEGTRILVGGSAVGRLLMLDEPLSLWGGLDPVSGRIVDPRHPQHGETVAGRMLALPVGKGSSSASSVLLEAVRLGTAPAAILLRETDGILALGATVARELYGRHPPVVVLDEEIYAGLTDGDRVEITADGVVHRSDDPPASVLSPTDHRA